MNAVGLPDTLDELANTLEITRARLSYWSYIAPRSKKYVSFEIPKSSGGTRTITAPTSPLKAIQRRLLSMLEPHYKQRRGVTGFVKGGGIVLNAERHVSKSFVLTVDIENFFPSINFGRVRGALMAPPLSLTSAVATVIAQIACVDNQLPQGAPTSPLLSNLVCSRMDSHLRALCRSHYCQYTRYADDISISTNRKSFPTDIAIPLNQPTGTAAEVGLGLKAVIELNGFKVNLKKVRLCGRSNAQQVTGLICNELVNVPRTYVRDLRALLHAWRKFGMEAAQTEYRAKFARARSPMRAPVSLREVVRGKLEFLAMVRGRYYPPLVRLAKQARALDASLFPFPLDQAELIGKAVWVLESESTSAQGTAFVLADTGMVTCAHVLAPDTVAFRVDSPGLRYPVKVKKIDLHVDLAVLEVPIALAPHLPRGKPSKLQQHSEIELVGFPGYGPGMHQAYRENGHVTMTKKRFGVQYIVPSTTIAQGNSGGPLLDRNGAVVGVAVHGVANLKAGAAAGADEFAAIFIDYVDNLPAAIAD